MKMKPVLKKIQTLCCCSLLLAVLAFWPSQGAARTERDDLPLSVRVVLSKAGALINEKQYDKPLAHADLQAGRYEPALVAMTVYSYLTPLSDQETKLLADLNLQLGIPVKAAPLYETALAGKTNPRLIRSLAMALQQLGKTEQALAALERYAPVDRDKYPELMMLRADLLYSMEHFREAAVAFRRTAAADKDNAGRAWLMAGYAALQLDDTKAGREAFEKAATFRRHRKAARMALRQLANIESKAASGPSRM
jgi:tetratricopeptide (TPR) repeat protein